ncbi:MAG: hypothetical protein JWQ84_1052 [Mucilaginibacter sp.]|nr:hypothetical protein [Mucilaginibacter sp.]
MFSFAVIPVMPSNDYHHTELYQLLDLKYIA